MTRRTRRRTRHPHPASHRALIDSRFCSGQVNSIAKLELMEGRVARLLAMQRKPVRYRTRASAQGMLSISDRYGEVTGLRPNLMPF
ncbi:hypothetical protein [Acidovorax sp. sic0104]|uniref:hypothetical protein n=1 Tax=Acidovorax sp. sic0104 TaxID=2854784 RepID=UPI001C46B3AB|nr:hypothetical protein [Acidovorax sp. sic0104]MBV7542011.1 hypothetical protein [Acidovorax sp. sic0104]